MSGEKSPIKATIALTTNLVRPTYLEDLTSNELQVSRMIEFLRKLLSFVINRGGTFKNANS